jgi:hypothetical protein
MVDWGIISVVKLVEEVVVMGDVVPTLPAEHISIVRF